MQPGGETVLRPSNPSVREFGVFSEDLKRDWLKVCLFVLTTALNSEVLPNLGPPSPLLLWCRTAPHHRHHFPPALRPSHPQANGCSTTPPDPSRASKHSILKFQVDFRLQRTHFIKEQDLDNVQSQGGWGCLQFALCVAPVDEPVFFRL